MKKASGSSKQKKRYSRPAERGLSDQGGAWAMAEESLEVLPDNHSDRAGLTALLSSIRLGDLSLVTEYRAWRRRDPKLTHAMVRAGRCADARLQRRLALWITGGRDGQAV